MNNRAFNTAFARAMAKRNNPESECQEENNSNVTVLPRSQRPESKTAIMVRAEYSRAIHENLNNLRNS